MQIAQIVVKTRTTKEEIFDYNITPAILPYIKVGVLVEVSFGNRKLEGIVVGLRRQSTTEKLKTISKIIDPNPVVDEIHIELTKWMSDYYLACLGKTLFENIVPPAKRLLKESSSIYRPSIIPQKPGRNALVIADFSNRIKFYLPAIKSTIQKNQSVIILVPDLSLIPFFSEHIRHPISILHAGLKTSERWKVWNDIREGKSKIVIGSQSALFAPTPNLGLLIIDQEENETYKSDQSPRYGAVQVAEKLCELSRARLIVGSAAPRVETYYQFRLQKYNIFRKRAVNLPATIISMTAEKSPLSHTLIQLIEKNLAKEERIVLVLNRKGEGAKFICGDCGWAALCPGCELPLVPQNRKNICHHCQKVFEQPPNCPKCCGCNLRPAGLSTDRIKNILGKIFPKIKIAMIEKGSLVNDLRWDIAIVTSYALKQRFPKIGLVGIIDADSNLNLPDYNSAQKSFQTYFKFLRLGEQKIIQTHLPENKTVQNLAAMNYGSFYQNEILIRRTEGFPPFSRLIVLRFRHHDEAAAQAVTEELFRKIRQIDPKIDILPPTPSFIRKKKEYFSYQLLIKTTPAHLKNQLNPKVKILLKQLPKNWIVNVDPFSLI